MPRSEPYMNNITLPLLKANNSKFISCSPFYEVKSGYCVDSSGVKQPWLREAARSCNEHIHRRSSAAVHNATPIGHRPEHSPVLSLAHDPCQSSGEAEAEYHFMSLVRQLTCAICLVSKKPRQGRHAFYRSFGRCLADLGMRSMGLRHHVIGASKVAAFPQTFAETSTAHDTHGLDVGFGRHAGLQPTSRCI